MSNMLSFVGTVTTPVSFGTSQSGRHFANFTLESVYDKSYSKPVATAIEVVVHNEMAEAAEDDIRVGDSVIAVGHLRLNSWTTKEGHRRSKHQMHVIHLGHRLIPLGENR